MVFRRRAFEALDAEKSVMPHAKLEKATWVPPKLVLYGRLSDYWLKVEVLPSVIESHWERRELRDYNFPWPQLPPSAVTVSVCLGHTIYSHWNQTARKWELTIESWSKVHIVS